MRLATTLARSLQADMQAELRDIERAVASGTRDAGRGLKTELRRQVASAGLGQRLARAWRDEHYPNQIMLHVIEHIPNPVDALHLINDLIKPGGILVMETPRYDTIWFKLLKGRERSVIPGHLYYFTGKTLTQMAADAGFKLISLNSVGRTLTLDRLCYSISKVSNSNTVARALTAASDKLHLNKVKIHLNTRDMMRLYLLKTERHDQV